MVIAFVHVTDDVTCAYISVVFRIAAPYTRPEGTRAVASTNYLLIY